MRPPLILHVNFVEQGQSLYEAFRKAEQWGYQGIELRRRLPKWAASDEAYLDEVAFVRARIPLEYVIFGMPGANLMLEDEAARRQEIEAFKSFYALASERLELELGNTDVGLLRHPDAGIPYVAYDRHGSFTATEAHWSQAVAGLREIGDFIGTLGIKLALETHMVYLHDLPQMALDLTERVGSPFIGVNLDYGNAVYFENRVVLEELLPKLRPHLHYVHLKNSLPTPGVRMPTALADGEINHRQYLRLLQEIGYEGPICLEAPRSGDREWYAQQDVTYINTLLDDIGWGAEVALKTTY